MSRDQDSLKSKKNKYDASQNEIKNIVQTILKSKELQSLFTLNKSNDSSVLLEIQINNYDFQLRSKYMEARERFKTELSIGDATDDFGNIYLDVSVQDGESTFKLGLDEESPEIGFGHDGGVFYPELVSWITRIVSSQVK